MSVCAWVGGVVVVGGSRESKGGSKLNVLQRTGGPNLLFFFLL